MIRINLIASPADRPAHRDSAWFPGVAVAAGLATMVAALVVMVWWAWALRGEAAEVSRELVGARATVGTLAPAVERLRDAEALRAHLLGFVDLLEELHARRTTALRMLDAVSRVLPGDLWLSEVREESDGFFVRGHAATRAAVSDYVAALESAGVFGAPVDLVDSQRGDRSGGRELVSFEVRVPLPGAAGAP